MQFRDTAVWAIEDYSDLDFLDRVKTLLEEDENELVGGSAVGAFSIIFRKKESSLQNTNGTVYIDLKKSYNKESNEYVKYRYEEAFYEDDPHKWLPIILARLDTPDHELQGIVIQFLLEILSKINAKIILEKVNRTIFMNTEAEFIRNKNTLIYEANGFLLEAEHVIFYKKSIWRYISPLSVNRKHMSWTRPYTYIIHLH